MKYDPNQYGVPGILGGHYDFIIARRIKQENLKISIEEYRWKWAAALSPYYFVKRVLGYTKLQRDPHERMCVSMRNDWRQHKKIVRIQPRGIFKTTIYVIAGCIDRLCENPNEKILVGMNNATNARMKLNEIKGILEKNTRFRLLYGDWVKNAPRWQADSITIARARQVSAEGSIDAVGIDTRVTSRHYSRIILDDIVDREDRFSAAKRRETLEFFREVWNLVRDKNETPIEISGTRWHFDDLFAYIAEELNPELIAAGLEPFYIICEPVYYEVGEADHQPGELRYPAVFTEEVLRQLKINEGAVMFATQYLLKPVPDETQIFRKEAARYYDSLYLQRERCRVIGYHDPGLGETAKACYTPIITAYIPDYDDPVHGIEKGCLLVEEMRVDRYTVSQAQAAMLAAYQQHRHEVMGVERNGFQKVYADSLLRLETAPGVYAYLPIYAVTNTQSKQARIEAFEKYYTAGTVRFRSDWQTAPYDYREGLSQLWNYPMDDYRDVPDALAGLVDLANMGQVFIA